ncbi:MAG: phosphate ABC transporter permease PstA [Actinomycetota bacterium]|nr:phosphate ABC transporter permease PstA [Actinomycetota bacterium]
MTLDVETPPQPTAPSGIATFRRGRLTRVRAALSAGAGIAIAALLFAVTPLQGRADFLLVAYLLGAAGYLGAARQIEGRRAVVDRLAGLLVVTAVAICLLALGSILVYTAARGVGALSLGFFTHSMNGVGPRDTNGGAYHAILGTLEQVLLASLMSVPAGLLVAIYLTEFGKGRLATTVRLLVDLMVGIPSIVAGLFIYAFWVLGLHQGFSGLAAAMALSILMLPIVVRSSEEMIKLVPSTLREASYALGVSRWRTILRVVLPTASAGITTGVMLAVARVTGETAPLLLTEFGFDSINVNPFHGAQSALPLFVFNQASSAFDTAVDRAWAGALTLIVIVLVLTAAARFVTRRSQPA